MNSVWVMLEEWWHNNPALQRYSHLKIGNWCNQDDPHGTMPKLKGRAIEVRNLVPALASVWARVMDPNNHVHQAVLEGMKNSAIMDDVLDAYPDADVLPTEDCVDFVNASWDYAKCQNALADHYNKQQGFLVFDVTIKTHWTLHCAMEAPFLNPRLSWNFSGEDFMQKCRGLHQSCCKGNDGLDSVNKFATKYCHALQMIFRQFENGTRL
jgi:hypothetical protein